ncbi:hypothetical protein RUND412_006968 [Rhizina undulata]
MSTTPNKNSSDSAFLLSCILNGVGKVNFELVAKENGYSNPKSAANRLFALRKAHGGWSPTASPAGSPAKPAAGNVAGDKVSKTAGPPKRKPAKAAGGARKRGKKSDDEKKKKKDGC